MLYDGLTVQYCVSTVTFEKVGERTIWQSELSYYLKYSLYHMLFFKFHINSTQSNNDRLHSRYVVHQKSITLLSPR